MAAGRTLMWIIALIQCNKHTPCMLLQIKPAAFLSLQNTRQRQDILRLILAGENVRRALFFSLSRCLLSTLQDRFTPLFPLSDHIKGNTTRNSLLVYSDKRQLDFCLAFSHFSIAGQFIYFTCMRKPNELPASLH